jgi:hypothetical protein
MAAAATTRRQPTLQPVRTLVVVELTLTALQPSTRISGSARMVKITAAIPGSG